MFPIRDHNPSNRTPFVTYALVAVNVVVFLLMLPAQGRELMQIYVTWAMIPARIADADGYYTVVTSMFMHGGWMHIIGNMLFLWIFGDNLEDQLGHLPYLGFYLLSGVAGALLQYGADPTSTVPMVGASGAIAGVMGGYLLLFPKARIDVLLIFIIFFRVIALPAWVLLGLWFGLQALQGAASSGATGGVAYLAHVGGFLAGFALAALFWLRHGGPAYWARSHGHPPHPAAEYVERRSSIPPVPRRRRSDIPRVPRR